MEGSAFVEHQARQLPPGSASLEEANFTDPTTVAGKTSPIENGVVDLLENDGGNESDGTADLIEATLLSHSKQTKRKWPIDEEHAQLAPIHRQPPSVGEASFQARAQHMPEWMKNAKPPPSQQPSLPPQQPPQPPPLQHLTEPATANAIQQIYQPVEGQPDNMLDRMAKPEYISLNDFVPSWKQLVPPLLASSSARSQRGLKSYQLSLLNVSEFTITGLPTGGSYEPTSLTGLRTTIKQISRDHGKAVYERDPEANDGGKWRIPLGAYQAFFSYLVSQPFTTVEGISPMQLQVASLGRARLEKDYPSPERLMQFGVPRRLANTLAPFQRGGVDFVCEKGGRALIADEMGLGKSIQAIASMTIYHKEWPLLVLSPSGARYHWQNEFLNWCGPENANNSKALDFSSGTSSVTGPAEGVINGQEVSRKIAAKAMEPLCSSDVHVLTSAKDKVLANSHIKVVICSYGLAPRMVEDGSIVPGMFKCAIVDESHMLKNKASKRTSMLLPVLRATHRCVLLSGTPAFARPMELYPQLSILGTENDQWWLNEQEFTRKYAKGGNTQRRAELHTLLSGTIMIRRMKTEMLKQLPTKRREQAVVNVFTNEAIRRDFQECIALLRQGKGSLAKFARAHTATEKDLPLVNGDNVSGLPQQGDEDPAWESALKQQATAEVHQLANARRQEMQYALATRQHQLDPVSFQNLLSQMEQQHHEEMRAFYNERISQLRSQRKHQPTEASPGNRAVEEIDEPRSRKSLITYMYKRTGETKIPLVIEMLKSWLNNPAKGKLCIFAHHISVLDAIASGAGLVNPPSAMIYIRIDGSTSPKARQEQINAFQSNPSVRVALLGITAAGVAVTLTASSTVWFAELFWTPALLIQAEDRCHRIGQQARVQCLYLVARGTLDEILWKHVEKKFRDLGEFVEGKEKMRIVVHKIFNGAGELLSSLSTDPAAFEVTGDLEVENEHFAELETEISKELEEMERHESEMIKACADMDDEEGDTESHPSRKPETKLEDATTAKGGRGQSVGCSENEAICIIDDDEPDTRESQRPIAAKPLARVGLTMERKFPNLRLYKMQFSTKLYGLVFELFRGRVVVTGRSPDRLQALGATSKPGVGDIMLSVNRQLIPYSVQLKSLIDFVASALNRGTTEILFGEDDEFCHYFAQHRDRMPRHSLDAGGLYNNHRNPNNSQFDLSSHLPSMQQYELDFEGRYGFDVERVQGYVAVSQRAEDRVKDLGEASKPRIGDILLKVNGKAVPRHVDVAELRKVLSLTIRRGPSKLAFAAATREISASITRSLGKTKHGGKTNTEDQANKEPVVIDLIDD